MNTLWGFFAVLVAIHVVALALWPVWRSNLSRVKAGAVVIAIIIILTAGLWLPPEARVLRAILAAMGTVVALRIYSYHRAPRRNGWVDYAAFISVGLWQPYLIYSAVGHPLKTQVNGWRELLRMVWATSGIVIAILLAGVLIRSPLGHAWLANHLILVGVFVVVMECFGVACGAWWRLRGTQAKRLVDHIYLSRTPADFWRRWSWPMHAWLYRYGYTPVGGRGHRFLSVMAAFLISGVLHEVMAAVALGRVTGHQTIFFLLNGLGVTASPSLERLARWGRAGEILMRSITLGFMVLTASFMFTTLHYIYALYYQTNWLMW